MHSYVIVGGDLNAADKQPDSNLPCVDSILQLMHAGIFQANLLSSPNSEAVNEQDAKIDPCHVISVTSDSKEKLDTSTRSLSGMIRSLEKAFENEEKASNGSESDRTYHVTSPKTISLTRAPPVTVSCRPAAEKPDAEKPDAVKEIKIAPDNYRHAKDAKEGDDVDGEQDSLLACDNEFMKMHAAGMACADDVDLSWDGYLGLTPGKRLARAPVQSTPAKEGESLLVIPDLKPYSKPAFNDRADKYLSQQYRKQRQIMTSSFRLSGLLFVIPVVL